MASLNEEVAEISAKVAKTIDALLIGRKTFEVMIAAGQTYPGGEELCFYAQRKSCGVEKGPERASDPIERSNCDRDAPAFVRELKQKGKGIVIFGGGDLAKTLFEADLIDEIVLNIQPVLLGSGIPLFHEMTRQIDLKLLNCRPLKDGGLAVTYRVTH